MPDLISWLTHHLGHYQLILLAGNRLDKVGEAVEPPHVGRFQLAKLDLVYPSLAAKDHAGFVVPSVSDVGC